MVLVLVNTLGGKVILEGLKENKIKTAVMLPSVYDAALYGVDNALVGSMENSRIRKIISENKITAVIDALDQDKSEVSQTLIEICGDLRLPLLKFVSFEYDYSGFDNLTVLNGYSEAVKYLLDNKFKVFVFGEIKNTKKFTDMLSERQNVYRLVLKGSEMNVDFAAESGIPLANLIAVDSVENTEEISRAMKAYEINRFLSFECPHSINAAKLAEKVGTEIIIVKEENSDYIINTSSSAEILDLINKYENADAKPNTCDLSKSENVCADENELNEEDDCDNLSTAFEDGREEYSIPKSKVVNKDGTVNMKNFVKYVKNELNI